MPCILLLDVQMALNALVTGCPSCMPSGSETTYTHDRCHVCNWLKQFVAAQDSREQDGGEGTRVLLGKAAKRLGKPHLIRAGALAHCPELARHALHHIILLPYALISACSRHRFLFHVHSWVHAYECLWLLLNQQI